MNLILSQIINCPDRGIIKQIYLGSKSLELLALKLADLEQNKTTVKYKPKKYEV